MVRWIKLLGNQYLGFWILGLVLFLIQEIPYMVMPLFKLETNPIMNMQEASDILDVCEKILGSLCVVFLTFIVHCEAKFFSVRSGKELFYFCIIIGVLLLNFFGWSLYFTGHQSILVMLFYLVEPLCYSSYLFFDRAFKKLGFFCIEKGNGIGEMQPFVCSWSPEGEHSNYGNCTLEKQEDLLRCADIFMKQEYGMKREEES